MKDKSQAFQFKQFSIHQDKTAMKVGTDGVLLGAWTDTTNAEDLLDIGTGTGLLSLMLAQRTEAEITAIEIDAEAAEQAKENFLNSPWAKQISLWNASIQTYAHLATDRYDLIVSNPPYFQSDKAESSREKARQQGSLSFEDLIHCASSLLKSEGRFCVIIPSESKDYFSEICTSKKLFLHRVCSLYGKPESACKRVLLEYTTTKQELIETSLTIEGTIRHDYSREYLNLVKDYLLIA